MPDTTRIDQAEKIDVNYEWLKAKFPILVTIFLFASFSLILGFIAPKFASCCGIGCPIMNENDILTASLNDRIDIIGSIQLKLLMLVSMVALVPATLFYGHHKVWRWTLFDHTIIFVYCIWAFRTILLLNIISGFRFGGCI